jgi:hypothetical protein
LGARALTVGMVGGADSMEAVIVGTNATGAAAMGGFGGSDGEVVVDVNGTRAVEKPEGLPIEPN